MTHGNVAFFLLAFAVLALAAAASPRWAGVVAAMLALLAIVLVIAGVIPA